MAGEPEPESVKLRRIFLDTSALFAGIWSENGEARLILRFAEAGAIQVVLNRQVLDEMDTVLRKKAPRLLPGLAVLLDRIRAEVASPGSDEQYRACLALCGHPGDARILADAWQAEASFLVSLNQKHILGRPELTRRLPYEIGTPGDYVQKMRAALS